MMSSTQHLICAALVSLAAGGVLAARPSAAQGAATGAQAIPYTEAQAVRGHMLFRRHCLFCHSTNKSNQKTPAEPLRGAKRRVRR